MGAILIIAWILIFYWVSSRFLKNSTSGFTCKDCGEIVPEYFFNTETSMCLKCRHKEINKPIQSSPLIGKEISEYLEESILDHYGIS